MRSATHAPAAPTAAATAATSATAANTAANTTPLQAGAAEPMDGLSYVGNEG